MAKGTSKLQNAPSTTNNKSGKGRGNNPPKSQGQGSSFSKPQTQAGKKGKG